MKYLIRMVSCLGLSSSATVRTKTLHNIIPKATNPKEWSNEVSFRTLSLENAKASGRLVGALTNIQQTSKENVSML